MCYRAYIMKMKKIKNLLEHKWKLIKFTYYYTSQVGIRELFKDYLDLALGQGVTKDNIDSLMNKGLLPEDFLEDWKDKRSWNTEGPLSNKSREDFYMIHKVHGLILGKILEDSEGSALDLEKETRFDEQHSSLIINDNKVKVQKFSNQYHTLKIIFENDSETAKEWFFSEIGERIDSSKNHSDKNYYNYISELKKKIAVETGVKDFFITTKQSVTINPEYLS